MWLSFYRLYLLRATAPAQPPLLTALPARCLATPGFQELLQVHMKQA